MRILEKILVILFLLGFVLLQNKVPGALVLTTFSLLLLAILYLFLGFAVFNGIGFRRIFKKESYKGVGVAHIVVSIISGAIIGLSVIAVLFNVGHWAGAGILRFTFVVWLAPVLIASGILTIVKQSYGKPILWRALPTFMFILYHIYKFNFSS